MLGEFFRHEYIRDKFASRCEFASPLQWTKRFKKSVVYVLVVVDWLHKTIRKHFMKSDWLIQIKLRIRFRFPLYLVRKVEMI